VSKADKKTSITSTGNKTDKGNNNGTKKGIKNPQSSVSVIISKPNYHYYQNIQGKMVDQVAIIITLILQDRRGAL
jgi:hypothetical protein